MDNKPRKKSASGVTPAKLALVGVLAVVLVGVLYMQFGRSKAPARASRAAPAASKKAAAKPSKTAPAPRALAATNDLVRRKLPNLSRWKSPDLAAIVQYDPFALPAAFPQPRPVGEAGALADETVVQADQEAALAAREQQRAQMKLRLEELRHQGVHVIVKSQDEYVAVVGDQEVRVGDQIHGFTVVAIDSDGVKVAWERSE